MTKFELTDAVLTAFAEEDIAAAWINTYGDALGPSYAFSYEDALIDDQRVYEHGIPSIYE